EAQRELLDAISEYETARAGLGRRFNDANRCARSARSGATHELTILAVPSKMFVGHYSVAFAAKSEQNRIPLWVLFIAVQFLDYIWATLVLLGIEKLRVIKGFTAGSMLDSYYHPYSHSLIAALAWSVIVALIYKSVCSRHGCLYRRSAALIVGVA